MITKFRIGLSPAALILAAVLALIFPATARAAVGTARPASAAPTLAAPAARSASSAAADCVEGWQPAFLVIAGAGGGSTAVEWDSNTCNWLIRDRSWCRNADGTGYWSYSGIVKATYLWDGSACPDGTTITRGEEAMNAGNGWTTYQTFWTNPAAL
jgi:hypothetical protein